MLKAINDKYSSGTALFAIICHSCLLQLRLAENSIYLYYFERDFSMSNSKVLLYGYPISSATWRVRAAMIYKRVEFEEKTVDIFAGDADYKTNVNPMGFVPAVKFPQNDQTFFESLPIMELLDALYPESPILPKDPFQRARNGFTI
jgi:hypothetical protein